jgi:SAM-dependent methyltransferase
VQKYQLTKNPGIGLDIGGGPGNLVTELSQRTPNFYWINTDINTFNADTYFHRMLTNDCAPRVGFVFADVHHLPFRDNYADIVVSRGSFHFWADPKTAFSEIARVLKPGGHAVIGRGFSPNLPVEIAKRVRTNQGKGMPKYDVRETVVQLRDLMKDLKIIDFEIVQPRSDQTEVSYGVWLCFKKTG